MLQSFSGSEGLDGLSYTSDVSNELARSLAESIGVSLRQYVVHV
jgi:hypothetical protein